MLDPWEGRTGDGFLNSVVKALPRSRYTNQAPKHKMAATMLVARVCWSSVMNGNYTGIDVSACRMDALLEQECSNGITNRMTMSGPIYCVSMHWGPDSETTIAHIENGQARHLYDNFGTLRG